MELKKKFCGGKADIFPEAYGFLRELRLFIVSRVSCQGVGG